MHRSTILSYSEEQVAFDGCQAEKRLRSGLLRVNTEIGRVQEAAAAQTRLRQEAEARRKAEDDARRAAEQVAAAQRIAQTKRVRCWLSVPVAVSFEAEAEMSALTFSVVFVHAGLSVMVEPCHAHLAALQFFSEAQDIGFAPGQRLVCLRLNLVSAGGREAEVVILSQEPPMYAAGYEYGAIHGSAAPTYASSVPPTAAYGSAPVIAPSYSTAAAPAHYSSPGGRPGAYSADTGYGAPTNGHVGGPMVSRASSQSTQVRSSAIFASHPCSSRVPVR